MFFTAGGVRCASLGKRRSPARAGAGQHVEEQRRLQALITRGSSTKHFEKQLKLATAHPVGRVVRIGFRLPNRLFIAGAEWGQSGRWTSKSATKCNELRWGFPARRRVSSAGRTLFHYRSCPDGCID